MVPEATRKHNQAMRREFGKFMSEYGAKDERIIWIIGDAGFGIHDDFRLRYPDRFFNFGLCEQSMISVACGLALSGLIPFVHAATPFLIERPFEQIKLDIDLQKTNVKLVGFADYPFEGLTHAELDSPYLMKIFKNIKSYFPQNSTETRAALEESYEIEGPAFISLKRDLDV